MITAPIASNNPLFLVGKTIASIKRDPNYPHSITFYDDHGEKIMSVDIDELWTRDGKRFDHTPITWEWSGTHATQDKPTTAPINRCLIAHMSNTGLKLCPYQSSTDTSKICSACAFDQWGTSPQWSNPYSGSISTPDGGSRAYHPDTLPIRCTCRTKLEADACYEACWETTLSRPTTRKQSTPTKRCWIFISIMIAAIVFAYGFKIWLDQQ